MLKDFQYNRIWAYFVNLPAWQSIWLPDKCYRHILPTFWNSDSIIELIILKTHGEQSPQIYSFSTYSWLINEIIHKLVGGGNAVCLSYLFHSKI